MPRSAGLEITDASVRIVWIEQNGKKTRFLAFHEEPIPPVPDTPWEARATEALRQAFAQSKIPRSRAVAALDSGEAILREVSLPFKNDDQIRRTVRFEMESLIHNYTIEQLIVSHFKTGETDKSTLLLAAAVPKTVIEKRLALMQGAGVDPIALDLDVSAIFNAALHAGAIDSDAPRLLIYGTPKFTKLIFIEDRRPRSIRTIRFSLAGPEAPPEEAPLEEAPPEEAVQGLPPADTAIILLSSEDVVHFQELGTDVQSSLVQILSKEISRFLLANAASAQPTHILLTGQFEDTQAAQMLEAATQIPTRTFNLVEALDPKSDPALREKSSRLGVPLGLALKGAGVDALGLDFRQEEFQYRKKFETIKTTALVTMELVIVFLAAIALHLYFKKKDVARDTATVLKHQQKLYAATVGADPPKDPLMAYPKMKELYDQARLMGGTELPIKVSAREAWRDLFNALDRFRRTYGRQTLGDGDLYLEIDGIEITQNTGSAGETFSLTFRGKIRNLQFADALKEEIRTVELFRNADWSGPISPLEGMVQFVLKATKGGKT
jgi:Tfp pilus assembly PilM family ATPase